MEAEERARFAAENQRIAVSNSAYCYREIPVYVRLSCSLSNLIPAAQKKCCRQQISTAARGEVVPDKLLIQPGDLLHFRQRTALYQLSTVLRRFFCLLQAAPGDHIGIRSPGDEVEQGNDSGVVLASARLQGILQNGEGGMQHPGKALGRLPPDAGESPLQIDLFPRGAREWTALR